MLWGAGLQGSPWQVRRNAVLRPAVDSPVTSAPPASPGLDPGPFTVIHEASVVRNLPARDSVNALWLLGAQPCDRLSERSHLPYVLSCGLWLFEVHTQPVLWCVTRLLAAPGSVPSCPSRVG